MCQAKVQESMLSRPLRSCKLRQYTDIISMKEFLTTWLLYGKEKNELKKALKLGLFRLVDLVRCYNGIELIA